MRQIHGVDRATSPAESFALLTILFRSLVACSHAAIFVGFPESFPTLLIASLLIWILLLRLLLSHLECIRFRPTRPSFLMANRSPRYLTPQAWPQLARLAAPSSTSSEVALPTAIGSVPGPTMAQRGCILVNYQRLACRFAADKIPTTRPKMPTQYFYNTVDDGRSARGTASFSNFAGPDNSSRCIAGVTAHGSNRLERRQPCGWLADLGPHDGGHLRGTRTETVKQKIIQRYNQAKGRKKPMVRSRVASKRRDSVPWYTNARGASRAAQHQRLKRAAMDG